MIKVGVLELQGDFELHHKILYDLGIGSVGVKFPEHLNCLDGLIIPGGESTTMSLLIDSFNLRNSILDFSKKKPVLGTCAGVILMSKKMIDDCKLIKEFLYINVYNHNKLQEKRLRVEKITKKLFEYFLKNFHSLPSDWLMQEKVENKYRIICDYISGMTDRYASKLYKSIYE